MTNTPQDAPENLYLMLGGPYDGRRIQLKTLTEDVTFVGFLKDSDGHPIEDVGVRHIYRRRKLEILKYCGHASVFIYVYDGIDLEETLDMLLGGYRK